MKQKSGWKRITLLRKTSFKKRLKILAGYKRQPLLNRVTSELPVIRPESMASAEINSYKPTSHY